MRLGVLSICNKGETMSKRPPANSTGKLALAGKRKQAHQILDCKQRERDSRALLSLVGKNSSVASGPKTVTCHNDRYAACITSAETAHLHTDLLAISKNICAHGISDVAEKIVFDGDGGKSAELVSIADLVVGEEESDTGKEDDKDTDNLSGSSGSSGGGARMRRDCAARDAAEALITLPVPEVIVKVGNDDRSSVMLDMGEVSFFSCCIDRYCLAVDDQTSPRQVCMNCNYIAHLACSEALVFQNPVEMEFAVSVRDFTKATKSRIRVIPKSQHGTILFCILCKANIKAIKVTRMAKKLPNAPHKSPFIAKFSIKILAQLRRLVAFHCQAFVFLEYEKTSQLGTYAMIEEQFYGDPEKRIKGACEQLIDGDNAFGFLYNIDEGENGLERTLKSFCCGSSTLSNYVAGVHFTVEMIGLKLQKRLTGRSLWRAGQDVLRSIKKAMAIVPKLDGKGVNLGKNHKV